jgi:hypothetical protein
MQAKKDDYVELYKKLPVDKVIKPQMKGVFSEDAYDFKRGGIIGGPVDVKGGKEEGY